MTTPAGKYKEPVVLLRYEQVRDPRTRETLLTPVYAGRTRAAVLPLSNQRVEAARQLYEGAAVEVHLRYRPGLAIDTTWAVWHRGLMYEVGAVLNPGTGDVELRLICGAGKPLQEPPAP